MTATPLLYKTILLWILLVCAPFSVAAADWGSGNIECTVSEIKTDPVKILDLEIGTDWDSFIATYSRNDSEASCAYSCYAMGIRAEYSCTQKGACKAWRLGKSSFTITLPPGTINAKKKVCQDIYNQAR